MARPRNVRRDIQFMLNGYAYGLRRVVNETSYLRCTSRNLRCKGKGRLFEDGVFVLDSEHSHTPNPNLAEDVEFMNQLHESCVAQFRNTRVIYDEIAIRFQRSAVTHSYRRVYQEMNRWQRQSWSLLPHIETIDQFVLLVNGFQHYTRHFHDCGIMSVTSTSYMNADETSLILGDPAMINRLGNINNIHFLSTVSVLPDGLNAANLLTVVVNHNNHSFSCLWAVMTNRRRWTIDRIMNDLRLVFMPNVNPRTIYTDFDQRMYGALEFAFPDSNIQTTFYEYCNVLFERADVTGLLPFDVNSSIIFRKLMALSLLPANVISEEFTWLRASIPENLRQRLNNLLNYFNTHWIQGVTPRYFSFYKNGNALTDCGMLNSIALFQTLGFNPNVWTFTRTIGKIISQAVKDLEKLQRKTTVNVTPRVRQLVDRVDLQRAWNLLDGNKIDTHRFLAIASFLVAPLYHDIIHRNMSMVRDIELLRDDAIQQELDEFQDFEFLIDDANEELAVLEVPIDDGVNAGRNELARGEVDGEAENNEVVQGEVDDEAENNEG